MIEISTSSTASRPAAADAPGGDLVSRIVSGDDGTEEELIESFGRKLFFLLHRWTGDAEAARDLYQETFRLALGKIRSGEVRRPDKLPAFLHGLARNLARRHFETLSRQRRRHCDLEPDAPPLSDTDGDPLGRLLGRERADLVRRALAELRQPRDREILTRYYLTEQPKERICAELGVTENHFKRVLFRARQRYRSLFEQRTARSER